MKKKDDNYVVVYILQVMMLCWLGVPGKCPHPSLVTLLQGKGLCVALFPSSTATSNCGLLLLTTHDDATGRKSLT